MAMLLSFRESVEAVPLGKVTKVPLQKEAGRLNLSNPHCWRFRLCLPCDFELFNKTPVTLSEVEMCTRQSSNLFSWIVFGFVHGSTTLTMTLSFFKTHLSAWAESPKGPKDSFGGCLRQKGVPSQLKELKYCRMEKRSGRCRVRTCDPCLVRAVLWTSWAKRPCLYRSRLVVTRRGSQNDVQFSFASLAKLCHFGRAGDGDRTRDVKLGKLAFYRWITPACILLLILYYFTRYLWLRGT